VGLLVFGDSGAGDQTQVRLADGMTDYAAGHQVDALVTTGDNVYPDGNPARFPATLDRPYADLRDDHPLWVTLGNHDVEYADGRDQLKHVGLPSPVYEQVVTRNGVSVQVLVLDSNETTQSLADQAHWLDTKLSEGSYQWRVVTFHHPVWSCSDHGSTQATADAFLPVTAGRANLVLQGHDHNYQRFNDKSGTRYIVTGGGGKDLYPIRACPAGTPAPAVAVSEHHFLAVAATSGSLTVTAVTATGQALDTFTLWR
jgi:hypothetical protein